jgi:hypothetical protein
MLGWRATTSCTNMRPHRPPTNLAPARAYPMTRLPGPPIPAAPRETCHRTDAPGAHAWGWPKLGPPVISGRPRFDPTQTPIRLPLPAMSPWHPKGTMRPFTPLGGPPGPPAKPWTEKWPKYGHLVLSPSPLAKPDTSSTSPLTCARTNLATGRAGHAGRWVCLACC